MRTQERRLRDIPVGRRKGGNVKGLKANVVLVWSFRSQSSDWVCSPPPAAAPQCKFKLLLNLVKLIKFKFNQLISGGKK